MAGRIEDVAPLGEAQPWVHAKPDALEQGRQMPRLDQLPVHHRLAPHRIETKPVEEGAAERVHREHLVEPGKCAGRPFESDHQTLLGRHFRGRHGVPLPCRPDPVDGVLP